FLRDVIGLFVGGLLPIRSARATVGKRVPFAMRGNGNQSRVWAGAPHAEMNRSDWATEAPSSRFAAAWFTSNGPASSSARLVRHLLQHLAQHTGRAHAFGEGKAQRRAAVLQFEAVGIAADAAPVAIGRAEQLGRIEPHRISVVVVHVLD